LAVLALGANAAQAENGVFYLGAGGTRSRLTVPDAYQAAELNNNSWKAFAGVRPLKWFAVEVDYVDLGSGSGSYFSNEAVGSAHADSSAWAAYAVGFLPVPLPVVDFYGKAGVARWKLNGTVYFSYQFPPYDATNTSTSSTGTDFAWGIGVQAHINIVGARLEYEEFNVNGNPAKIWSLSAFLNF